MMFFMYNRYFFLMNDQRTNNFYHNMSAKRTPTPQSKSPLRSPSPRPLHHPEVARRQYDDVRTLNQHRPRPHDSHRR